MLADSIVDHSQIYLAGPVTPLLSAQRAVNDDVVSGKDLDPAETQRAHRLQVTTNTRPIRVNGFEVYQAPIRRSLGRLVRSVIFGSCGGEIRPKGLWLEVVMAEE